jgi:prepilin-type N-terminal cleavage/methylation domain-containing protein
MRGRAGLTLIELIVAIAIIGIVAAFAIPGVKRGMATESIRGARRSVTAHLARTRGTAANRGCRSVLHLRGGASARIWITSCTMAGTGVDTIGGIENLSDRFGVVVATSGDSVMFAPNGLGRTPGGVVMKFSKAGYTDSLGISPIGWPAW